MGSEDCTPIHYSLAVMRPGQVLGSCKHFAELNLFNFSFLGNDFTLSFVLFCSSICSDL